MREDHLNPATLGHNLPNYCRATITRKAEVQRQALLSPNLFKAVTWAVRRVDASPYNIDGQRSVLLLLLLAAQQMF